MKFRRLHLAATALAAAAAFTALPAQAGKDLDAIKAEKNKETGRYYRLMIEHVRHVLSDIKRVCPAYDEKQGFELSGFAWLQGWNELVDSGVYPNRNKPGGYDAYSEAMAHFIRDVREDLNAPKMPFVIGVLGVGGAEGVRARAAIPPPLRGRPEAPLPSRGRHGERQAAAGLGRRAPPHRAGAGIARGVPRPCP